MKPQEFPEQTVVIAKDQPEYTPLPAHIKADGEIIYCMGLSWKERFAILIKGKIWCSRLTFGQKLQPSYYTTDKKELIREEPVIKQDLFNFKN